MKTFKQHITEAKSFKYYYHVTFKKNVKKIMGSGLKPLQTSNWIKGSGQRYNDYGGVYAFEHPEDAYRWAFKMGWEFKKDISIIRMKKSKQWEDDPSEDITLQMGGKGKAIMSKGAVPASQMVDSFDVKDFGYPADKNQTQAKWMKDVVKALS